jgi:aldose 1-epimerase
MTALLDEAPDIGLAADGVKATISPSDGGRITSFRLGGRELLVTEGRGPFETGCFPMAPFAGRIRDARFWFRGREWRLPRNGAPHAIHGSVASRPWRQLGATSIAVDLGPYWPFKGQVTQTFELTAERFRVRMELIAHESMPAVIGWHPWFRWTLGDEDEAASERAELRLEAALMYERADDGVAIGRLVEPTAGPWDDCFTGLVRPPVIRWPGVAELTVASSCAELVVFTASDHGLCVEPQTGPPDAANLRPRIVEPGVPLRADMTWTWRRP